MLNHERKFPSKRGFVIYIPLIILIIVEAGYIAGGRYIGAVLVLVVVSAMFLPVFFNTYYAISNTGTLRVKCGMFFNTKLPIGSIIKVENTRTVLSAPALSTDRIEIFYNKFDSVVISPKNIAEFVAELQKINPDIRYQ
ncbi:PH domain-containing protein [Mucilaginibacter sp. ZT4R22]|uniref:PH domain-containing protein n=1 Tax=Mucilaginibacter pankratovii TaxID=2772110 RepID=A0ABR7WVZ8_9SPHI|nr:PH domain-containing protein [Mucilaginibacter pankratovii]MBD1366460.1 PH domain-containing protein [Mucilaginibacter pankratovii]